VLENKIPDPVIFLPGMLKLTAKRKGLLAARMSNGWEPGN
jgi:hypothetical protein